ncbi:MAG TPA: hypothetical protein PLR44_00485 [Thermomicrobiales bacterium]|nr:hypothetical protein [Chloroflexota bacterium]HQZ88516.1 hypothetical protein [Thermomicrobiales bacterium]HRA30370.1 hypothetical protein [Thermomicrobiales bacterium]
MKRFIGGAIALIMISLIWITIGRLVAVTDAGVDGMRSGRAIIAYLLLFAAPTATFIPLRRWTRIPLYDLEGIAAWSTLGFALIFLRPDSPPSMGQFLFFTLALTAALATVCTLASFLVGLRLYRHDARRYDVVRARRQGYLAASFVVALLIFHGIGTLTPTSGTLLLVLVVLAELFSLSRSNGKPANERVAGYRSRA